MHTIALCPTCLQTAPAIVKKQDGALYLEVNCSQCGLHTNLIEHDAELYEKWNLERRPNVAPASYQKKQEKGCPFDCGLCENHKQKSCISLIEITTKCDLSCPICYASSGGGEHVPFENIVQQLNAAVETAGGKPDVLQISGGEPTTHPQLIEILKEAMKLPFKYVMLNTNGLNIVNGNIKAEDLKALGNGFEIHLQFDGLTDNIYETLRGRSLLNEKLKILDILAEAEISVTLVATLRRNLNLEQCGDILRFALDHPAVRGMNFQCEAFLGRNTNNPEERVTQTEVANQLAETASELLTLENFTPLSCGLANMIYFEKLSKKWQPIPKILAKEIKANPMTVSLEEVLSFAKDACVCKSGVLLKELAKRLPKNLLMLSKEKRSKLVHQKFFHLTIISFLDAYNFDLNRASRECTHILQQDGTKIPFSAYNTIYRK